MTANSANDATRGYRDVASPEARARIWNEAREHSERDSAVLLERARSRKIPFGFSHEKPKKKK